MKNWLRKNMLTLCSACLALSTYIHFGAHSIIFFGEPEFPAEE